MAEEGSARLAIIRQIAAAGGLESAISESRRLIAAEPRNKAAYELLAELSLRNGNTVIAKACLEQCAMLDPGSMQIAHQLFTISYDQGDFGLAVRAARHAVRLAPGNPGAWCNLGAALHRMGDAAEAGTAFNRALVIAPDDPVILCNLGSLHKSLGDRDAAADRFDLCLSVNPDADAAFLGLVQSRPDRLRPETTAHFKTRLEQSDDAEHQITIGFAFAMLAEIEGNYREAAEYYRRANEGRARDASARGIGYVAANRDRRVAEILSRPFPKLTQQPGDTAVPAPIFIVGMPRSGTTLVEQILASHPAVAAGGERSDLIFVEQHCLAGAPLPSLRQLYWKGAIRLPDATRYLTDKLPGNLDRLDLAARIFPEARFIMCRRAKIDTCVSLYTNNLGGAHSYSCDFASLAHFAGSCTELERHWTTCFGDRLLIIDHEALVGDPEQSVRSMLRHLDIEWHPNCLEYWKTSRPIMTASDLQVRQPVHNTNGRWRRYGDFFAPLAEMLAD